ncbi:MAG TPA: RidA family protein [Candidatus Krumholzibacteria bacterium]|jgi:2-iminobutanoate/2-iminopropanoate deaminase|nr:RidA family protein [Candidatus Krumholzibacteria bacterium]
MRRVIQTPQAPAAIGPYSQGVAVGSFLHTAGQIGLDPATGKLVGGGIETETRRALQNLRAIVEAAGARLEDVVKTTVFLTTMDDFAAMNRVYAEFFPEQPPARSTVAVLALPAGARVEIEALVRGA